MNLPADFRGSQMVEWAKTKHVGVRVWFSDTRKHRGRADKCFVIRYKKHGQSITETIGWESEGFSAQYSANIRSEITANIKMGKGHQSLKDKQAIEISREKAEKNLNVNLRKAFQDFLCTRQLKARTIKDYQKFMDSIFKDWEERKIKNITREMVSIKHKQLGDKVGHAQANQAFRFLRSLLNYCMAKYEDVDESPLIKFNPVLILTQTRQWFRVDRRQTIIKNKDLPKWFENVLALKSSVVRDYLLTILLSGLRRNEALPLKKKDIDLAERTITLLDTKNNKPFLIPIPNFLHDVLKERVEDENNSLYVFPSRMKGRHITEPQSGINAVIKASKIEFCSHDLRRLFVTTAEALDLSPFVIKRLVNHAIGSDNTSGYIVSDLDRLREPIQKIEDKILVLVKPK
ncbi:tyrosine-type recombinase/integrase [Nitrospinae bacterium]|nr:tyrosine-type recombinase/integrase [Nitrospinota bacterium]